MSSLCHTQLIIRHWQLRELQAYAHSGKAIPPYTDDRKNEITQRLVEHEAKIVERYGERILTQVRLVSESIFPSTCPGPNRDERNFIDSVTRCPKG